MPHDSFLIFLMKNEKKIIYMYRTFNYDLMLMLGVGVVEKLHYSKIKCILYNNLCNIQLLKQILFYQQVQKKNQIYS